MSFGRKSRFLATHLNVLSPLWLPSHKVEPICVQQSLQIPVLWSLSARQTQRSKQSYGTVDVFKTDESQLPSVHTGLVKNSLCHIASQGFWQTSNCRTYVHESQYGVPLLKTFPSFLQSYSCIVTLKNNFRSSVCIACGRQQRHPGVKSEVKTTKDKVKESKLKVEQSIGETVKELVKTVKLVLKDHLIMLIGCKNEVSRQVVSGSLVTG